MRRPHRKSKPSLESNPVISATAVVSVSSDGLKRLSARLLCQLRPYHLNGGDIRGSGGSFGDDAASRPNPVRSGLLIESVEWRPGTRPCSLILMVTSCRSIDRARAKVPPSEWGYEKDNFVQDINPMLLPRPTRLTTTLQDFALL